MKICARHYFAPVEYYEIKILIKGFVNFLQRAFVVNAIFLPIVVQNTQRRAKFYQVCVQLFQCKYYCNICFGQTEVCEISRVDWKFFLNVHVYVGNKYYHVKRYFSGSRFSKDFE